MTTHTETRPLGAEELLDASNMSHIVCCDDDIALCGIDVSDTPWRDDDFEVECVVCAELEDYDCPKCGW